MQWGKRRIILDQLSYTNGDIDGEFEFVTAESNDLIDKDYYRPTTLIKQWQRQRQRQRMIPTEDDTYRGTISIILLFQNFQNIQNLNLFALLLYSSLLIAHSYYLANHSK